MPYKDPEKRRECKRKYFQDNKELANQSRRNSRLLKTYGLTPEGFGQLWDKQMGRCAICFSVLVLGTPNGCHVDHNHTTGNVRGLLCGNCNKGLGMFMDSQAILQGAIAYLAMDKR